MPIYTSSDVSTPTDIQDGNGNVISGKYVVWVDTDTGEIRSHKLDSDGNYVIDESGNIERESYFYPSPLTLIPGILSDEPNIVEVG